MRALELTVKIFLFLLTISINMNKTHALESCNRYKYIKSLIYNQLKTKKYNLIYHNICYFTKGTQF